MKAVHLRRSVATITTTAVAVALLLFGVGALSIRGIHLQATAQTDDALSSVTLAQLPIRLTQSAQIRPTGQVRQFDLTARPAVWELLPGVQTAAFTYNGTVPGPLIRVTEGDTLRVNLKNELDMDTSIHWHGLHVPNAMDGVPGLTQPAVRPGESFTYEFVVSHAGTFMYHPHINSVAQIDKGLYGLLIIDPQTPDPTHFDKEFTMMLGAWQINSSSPSTERDMPGMQDMPGMMGMPNMSGSTSQPMSGGSGMNMDYNYFTINGKSFPSLEPWTVKQGDLVRIRMANISNLAHPMHLHGQDFKVIAKDGEALPSQQQWVGNTISVDAGETYDVVFIANNPGRWMLHCHELHHTENGGVEPGGLMQIIQYEGYEALSSVASPNTAEHPATMPGMTMPGMGH